MDRGLDRDAQEIQPPDRRVERDPAPAAREAQTPGRERQAVAGRHRTFRISPAEQETLFEVGRFRTVAVEDLANHKYQGNSAQMQQDLRSLTAQGLVERRTALLSQGRGKLTVMVLTRAGKDLLERARKASPGQAVYAGFVKPAEVAYDAAIYRMFHKEAGRIEEAGGKIRRIVLDYELKRKIYSPLAKARKLPTTEYAKLQAQVAQQNGLRIVAGKIPLPDLRIEYETAEGELTRVDLELATHHYHGSHLRIKAEAGFKMYAAEGGLGRSPVPEDREITAEIFSL